MVWDKLSSRCLSLWERLVALFVACSLDRLVREPHQGNTKVQSGILLCLELLLSSAPDPIKGTHQAMVFTPIARCAGVCRVALDLGYGKQCQSYLADQRCAKAGRSNLRSKDDKKACSRMPIAEDGWDLGARKSDAPMPRDPGPRSTAAHSQETGRSSRPCTSCRGVRAGVTDLSPMTDVTGTFLRH